MRSKFPVTAHLFFIDEDSILLSRRYNTGWQDGRYSVPAGHLEAGESLLAAAIREAEEETGAHLTPADLEVVHVMHRKSDDERIDFFLLVKSWSGEISNREPQRCDELGWFPLTALPDEVIPYIRQALANFQAGIPFAEFGW
jgi:ADP-ribose pyrophosphatase YjhB (NUDIX family)